jgi:hypothetical protein
LAGLYFGNLGTFQLDLTHSPYVVSSATAVMLSNSK